MEQIKLELRSWNENIKTDTLTTEPTEFSYWVTHNLPLDDKLRKQLLKLDCPIHRLRRQLEIIQKVGDGACNVPCASPDWRIEVTLCNFSTASLHYRCMFKVHITRFFEFMRLKCGRETKKLSKKLQTSFPQTCLTMTTDGISLR